MMFWVIQALNGISFGMLLFMLAAGLSLIYGLMKILNLTHGSFYLLGGYIGLPSCTPPAASCSRCWPAASRWR